MLRLTKQSSESSRASRVRVCMNWGGVDGSVIVAREVGNYNEATADVAAALLPCWRRQLAMLPLGARPQVPFFGLNRISSSFSSPSLCLMVSRHILNYRPTPLRRPLLLQFACELSWQIDVRLRSSSTPRIIRAAAANWPSSEAILQGQLNKLCSYCWYNT